MKVGVQAFLSYDQDQKQQHASHKDSNKHHCTRHNSYNGNTPIEDRTVATCTQYSPLIVQYILKSQIWGTPKMINFKVVISQDDLNSHFILFHFSQFMC